MLLGCVAGGVLARERELERAPARRSGPARSRRRDDRDRSQRRAQHRRSGRRERLPLDGPALVALFVDPFTFPTATTSRSLNEEAARRCRSWAGSRPAPAGPDTQALILDGEVLDEGAVGAAVGGIPVRTVVSQGCAPFGRER